MIGRRVAPLVLVLALVATACGATSTASPTASKAATGAPGASTAPIASEGASGTLAPGGPSAAPSDTPAAPSAPASAPTPHLSGSPQLLPPGDPGTAECAGSAENRDFFAAAAQSFSWDVYCAVLPDGWFVDTGSFRLADGGTLVVGYRGPGDVRIDLQQGAYCTTGGSACSPRDHELGPAPYGDRSGTLVTLGPSESDGYAVYVDPGAAPSWSITGKGMDQATFSAIAAALHRVPR